MERLTHPVVLITGASSGIGEFLAYEFSKRGFRVALCARRTDKLRSVADRCLSLSAASQPLALEVDVTQRESINKAVDQTVKTFGKIDIVVANAGFGVAGRFDKLNLADFRRQFETNIDGVLNTSWASLDALKKSGGNLVLMGSVNSYVSQPKKAPYCMSKFAVRALAESLYVELKPHGVHITLICPGMVESEIRKVDNHGKFHAEIETKPPSWLTMPTEVAARKMVCGILKKEREVTITRHAKLGILLSRMCPSFLLWILRKFNPQQYDNPLRPLVILCALMGSLLMSSPGIFAQESDIHDLFRQLWSPYCPGLSLLECTSGQAQVLRDELSARANSGESQTQILADLEARYGDKLRMMPNRGGRENLAWTLPWVFAAIVVAGILGVAFGRKRPSLVSPEKIDIDPKITAEILKDLKDRS